MNLTVLLVGNFLSSSLGVRSVCEDLACQLTASGWSVVTTSSKTGRVARVSNMIGTVWRKRYSYDVAHIEVYSGSAFFWAELVCESLKWIGKPFALTLHGGNLPVFAERWPGRVRRVLKSAVAVTTPSTYLRERMKLYRADLILLPNPIDLSAYTFIPRTNPRPRLIWLRAFHHIYNPTLAPRVIARLAEEFPDLHLTMIGPDKGDGSLQKTRRLAEELRLTSLISFPGAIPKNEVPVWLHRGDIFLNTTDVDNTPVSIIEAMACGLCIVSTNAGGLPNLIKHDRDALFVPTNDADAMASAIRQLLTDQALSTRLTHKAREKAEQFDWLAILPQWEQLLIDVAKGRRDG